MKKPSVLSFFISAFLLAAAVGTHGKELVRDTNGNPVKTGQQYFIQPVQPGGGLFPAPDQILPINCPLGIIQTPNASQPGLPVSFSFPVSPPGPIQSLLIITSDVVNIEFWSNIWPVCNEFSKFWEVDVSSSVSKEPAILIGGEPQATNSWFMIEKAGEGAGTDTYNLTTLTGTIGTIPGAWIGAPKLIVTNDTAKTLLVKFKKVDDTITATTSTSRVEKLGLRMFPFY